MPDIQVKKALNRRDQKPAPLTGNTMTRDPKKFIEHQTPMRNTKTRRVLLNSITPKTNAKTPHRVPKKQLTPLKHRVNDSALPNRSSLERSRGSRSRSNSQNRGSLWIPGGHANSMGRNKLASLGKQINLEYKLHQDPATGASALF